MESCIEWLERRIESDCKFFPVDKGDMLRIVRELEELDKYKRMAKKLELIAKKSKAFEHLKHKIGYLDHFGKEEEQYLAGQITASLEFGLITPTEFWGLEELIDEKYLR